MKSTENLYSLLYKPANTERGYTENRDNESATVDWLQQVIDAIRDSLALPRFTNYLCALCALFGHWRIAVCSWDVLMPGGEGEGRAQRRPSTSRLSSHQHIERSRIISV